MPLDRNNFFENAFKYREREYGDTKNSLLRALNLDQLRFNLRDGISLEIGSFSTPTLSESQAELQTLIRDRNFLDKKVSGGNIQGDIGELHIRSKGVFMVASQFNTLEHVNPSLGPSDGTKNYHDDSTQGPICAMSTAAGLVYRNFCARFRGGIVSTDADAYTGQTDDNQINCFITVQKLIIEKAKELGIKSPDRKTHPDAFYFSQKDIPAGDFFAFQNGYIESTKGNLEALNKLLQQGGDGFKQQLKNALRVGIHRDTEVTSSDNKKLVTQVYASAIGINYSNLGDDVTEEDRKKLWEPLAKIVLEGAYEHTLLEGLKNNAKKILAGQPTEPILLTQLGGGAFKNDPQWIKDAMASAIEKAGSCGVPFDVQLVHYQAIDPVYQDGFLERAIAKANFVMTSSAPALTSRVGALSTMIEVNTNFLQQRGEEVIHSIYNQSNNYSLMFNSREDAENKSQELAKLGIVGASGNKKFVNTDGDKHYIILTDENIDKLKKIEAKAVAPALSSAEFSPPAPVPAPAQVTNKENLEFLQEFYQQKYGDRCIVNHEFDTRGQNNYTLIFKNLDDNSKDTRLPIALRESQSLADIGIVGSQGKKRVISHAQGPFIILTDENVDILKNIQSSLDTDAVRVDVDHSYGPARGHVRVVPIPPVPAPAPATAPAPALIEPDAIPRDRTVEENIRLLTENIKPSINNVTVEHEKKVAENQYRLVFQNADDTIKAYGLLSRRYDIIPEAKAKEKEGEFVIVLNDRNVEQFKSIILQQQSPNVWGGTAIASVSGGLSNLAGGVRAASSFGGGTGHRPAGAFDVDASLSFGGGAATSSFVEFEASRAGVGSRGAGYRPAGAFDVADAGASASASISFGESRVEGSRPQNSGVLMGRWSEPPHIVDTSDRRSPSPEVKTSDCFSCVRALFGEKARE